MKSCLSTQLFESVSRKFRDKDNPIEAAKAARNHLDTLVDATEVGPAMYRKHYWDLEQLVVGQFQSDRGRTAWKDYLTGIKGAAPVDMPNPHAHHILFKKGLGEAQQLLVREGQDLLRKVGIDPLFGEEVLYWAPNVSVQRPSRFFGAVGLANWAKKGSPAMAVRGT